MVTRTWWVMVVSAVAAASAAAGPVTVRQWVTPKPGQTPLDPPPGLFQSETIFEGWQPGRPWAIASFLPDDRWANPDTPYTPGVSKAGSRRYEFTYHAEVTEHASGRRAAFSLQGVAEADWMQRYDGLVLPGTVAVTLSENATFALAEDAPFRLSAREVRPSYDRIGAEVELTVRPTNTPEPGSLLLGVIGVAAGAGVWRRIQRRAVLTPDHLPQ